MQTKKTKILVTGADGFIGSHLVECLIRNDYNVRAFALYNSFNTWGWLDHVADDVAGSFEVITGDIRDSNCVREAMKDCDVVLHLAALIAIPFSYHSPGSYLETNVRGTLNILQAARDLGVDRVVVTSTSEVYGTAQFVPITELHPLNAQSPYAATKIASDQLALSFHKSFELPVTVLRPFNTYGPRQSARAVIPTVASQIAAGKKTIKLGVLHPTRDFTFVEDTAKGFMQIASCDEAIGQVVNIGSNFEISIGETAALIAEVMGTEIEIISDEQRVRPSGSEVERLYASTEVAQKIFNWNPEYGGREGFKLGLRKTVDWFRELENLAVYKTDNYNI